MSVDLGMVKAAKKTGEEKFMKDGKAEGFNLSEFWQWMASDFISNATRGILAEFIVGKALDIPLEIRAEWDPYDLEYCMKKIEVKSGAYIQAWKQKKLSTISFGIGKTKAWDAKTNIREDDSRRQCDVYVFSVLKETDQKTINPMILDQWEFYIVPRTKIDSLGEQATITLPRLKTLFNVDGKSFSEIRPAIISLIASSSI